MGVATAEPERFPIARVDLDEEIRRMRKSPKANGHLAKTVLHGDDLRLVLMILDHGTKIPEHHANGSLTIQTLQGRVIVALLGSSFDLGPGQLLAVAHGVTQSLVAIEDSAVLLTLSWKTAD